MGGETERREMDGAATMTTYTDLLRALTLIPRRPTTEFWIHPDHLADIARQFPPPSDRTWSLPATLFGVRVHASPLVPKYVRRWVPPRGKFWEMEASDEGWAEPLGFGGWEDVPCIWKMSTNTWTHRQPGIIDCLERWHAAAIVAP